MSYAGLLTAELQRTDVGISVSQLCLGAMMFGAFGSPDHHDAIKIIHKALDAGMTIKEPSTIPARSDRTAVSARYEARLARLVVRPATVSRSSQAMASGLVYIARQIFRLLSIPAPAHPPITRRACRACRAHGRPGYLPRYRRLHYAHLRG